MVLRFIVEQDTARLFMLPRMPVATPIDILFRH
jgi:hypothetical protein